MDLEVRNKIKEFIKDNFNSCIAKIGCIGTFFVDDILDTVIFEYNIEDKDYAVLESILWDVYNECKENANSNKSSINEEILVETKEDIDNFTNKFGKEAYDFITKYKQRFVNNKISTDLSFHTKNTSKEEMNKIISDLSNKVVKDEKGSTRLNYKYLGEEKGFKVYEILDWQTAMNMGEGTGWCIAGRYDTDEVKPSQAKKYFNQYKNEGYRFFYFISKNTRYCLQLNYNDRLKKLKTNFIIWDADDDTVRDLSKILSLPINLVKEVKIEETPDFDIKDGILIKYSGNDEEVAIPDGITSIGDSAFFECTSLTSVTIPDSVTSIGDSAFFGCDNITNIAIPDSVTNISDSVFFGCSNLTSVTIPDSVTSIGDFAFRYCNDLKDIYYTGSKEQFNKIKGLDYSNLLDNNPTVHYNSKSTNKSISEDIGGNNIKMKFKLIDEDLEDIDKVENTEQETVLTDDMSGVTLLLNNLIKDEFDAIDEYNSAITTLQSEGLGEDILSVLYDIVAEENVHVGQLQKALESINPIADKNIQDGVEEGTEQIEQSEIELEEDSNKNKVSNKTTSDNKLKYNKDVMKGWVTMDEWGYDPADDIYEKDYEDQINYYRRLKGVVK